MEKGKVRNLQRLIDMMEKIRVERDTALRQVELLKQQLLDVVEAKNRILDERRKLIDERVRLLQELDEARQLSK